MIGSNWVELLLRRSGLAGLVVAIGGALAIASATAPWWEAHAELTLAGASQGRAVTALAGWQHLPGVLTIAAGVVAVTLGLALAFDRHPGWTRPASLAAGAVAAVGASIGTWSTPALTRFPDRRRALADLRDVVDELPVGVELTLAVVRGHGAALAGIAAGIIVLGVASARELDRR